MQICLTIFALALVGQALTGWRAEIADRAQHAEAAEGLMAYLGGGPFLSALFENWESEFLQMWAFVMLTAYLFQRGSPESKDPDEGSAPQDRDPALDAGKADAPWPVRAGGPLSGWRLTWRLAGGQAIPGLWGGRLATSGSTVTVTNAPWDGALAAGGTATVGFVAAGSPSGPAVTCTAG